MTVEGGLISSSATVSNNTVVTFTAGIGTITFS
jgi:hypothetical protein